jgi:hypothetical protein
MSERERQPAGWYKDPWDAAPARWWDGAEWSAHTASPEDGTARSVSSRDIATGTVWIWLIVLMPLVPTVLLLAGDPLVALSAPTVSGAESTPAPRFTAEYAARLIFTLVVLVFAYADWRTLRSRGVYRAFGWGWTLLAGGVYVIGRGVVLRRQTGRGLAPVWAWIAVALVTTAIDIAYFWFGLDALLARGLAPS